MSIIIKNREYQIVKQLEETWFGPVFQVLDKLDKKYYAIKKLQLRENMLQNYEREVEILSNFNCENIIKYYDSYRDNNNFYILMEYFSDRNLRDFVDRYRKSGELIEGSTVKLSGNAEFGSKLGKLVSFKATAPGRVYVKWKGGKEKETERCGYLIQATEDSNIGKTMGYRNFAVSEEDGKALWSEDIFAFPAAGTYYLAGNAAYAIGGFKLYYDSTVTAEDVITYTELGEDPDVLNGTLAIPTDNAGYTAEHKIGNYTFGVGVVAKFYGSINGDTPIAYSCFELSDGEKMKFTASTPGTLSLRVTARSGAVEGVYPTSKLIATDASASTIAVTGIPEDGMLSSSNSKTKGWYNLSVQFTQAGEYTFTAENVVDIYSAKFSAIA